MFETDNKSRTDKGERCREKEQRHVGQGVHRDDAHRQLGDRDHPPNQPRGAVRPPREQGLAEDVAAAAVPQRRRQATKGATARVKNEEGGGGKQSSRAVQGPERKTNRISYHI